MRRVADPPVAPPPTIGPVAEGGDRPFFSVMIPTYESGEHLEQALRSVLDQDPGPERMQIAVVDDRSSDDHHERVVRALAPNRVECHTRSTNVGLARNWNGCIEMARGRWVHLLHQDDLVMPGFYDRLALADAGPPEVGAAFCRHVFIDGEGKASHPSNLERPKAGVLDGWLGLISRSQRIQCPSIIVRREVYEHLGGFRTDLCYALDWEMWVRIAARYSVWYEPEPLASYRIHDGNETARLKRANRDLGDILRAVRIIAAEIPPEHANQAGRGLLDYLRDHELMDMIAGLTARDFRRALAHLRRADRCDPRFKYTPLFRDYAKWSAKIVARGVFDAIRGAEGGPRSSGRGVEGPPGPLP